MLLQGFLGKNAPGSSYEKFMGGLSEEITGKLQQRKVLKLYGVVGKNLVYRFSDKNVFFA